MDTRPRCPQCGSRDLTKLPSSVDQSTEATAYKCQICSRNFNFTPKKEEN